MKEVWEIATKDEGRACTLLSFLMNNKCPFIAKPVLLECSRHGDDVHLLLEYEPLQRKMSLHSFLQHATDVSHADRVTLANQLVQAVAHMHECGIYHQFLSSDDITVVPPESEDGRPTIKIMNFFGGLSASSAYICVRNYRPPEVAVQVPEIQKDKVDAWAVGCLLFEIFTGEAPFTLLSSKDGGGSFRPQLLKQQLETFVHALGTLSDDDVPAQYPPRMKAFLLSVQCVAVLRKILLECCDGAPWTEDCISLVSSFLQFNPDKRISLCEMTHHALFVGMPTQEFSTAFPSPASLTELVKR